MDAAKEMFMGTNIKFTTEGKRHLGATISSENFRAVYAIEKVQEWCEEVKKLSKYAKTQPQAAFAAFCHGEQRRFSYFMRIIPGMEKFMEPLDETIHNIFLPSLFDSIITEDERLLFSSRMSRYTKIHRRSRISVQSINDNNRNHGTTESNLR